MARCVCCGDRARAIVLEKGAVCAGCAAELLTGDVHSAVHELMTETDEVPAHARYVSTSNGIKKVHPAFAGERAISHDYPLAVHI